MKNFKKFLGLVIVFTIISFVTSLIILFSQTHQSQMITALFVLAGFNMVLITFNLLVRKSHYFKHYFLSNFNIFSAKLNKQFEVEIPADLAFEIIKEVIAGSGFKLITENKEKMELLAISKPGWKSWGENIYFTVKENSGVTIVGFASAALFQVYSWGKNEENYSLFFQKLEDSFTV